MIFKQKRNNMNFYVYWYFTVYRIYERLSSDKYFDVFATAFFSLFPSFLFYSVFLIILNLLNASNCILNSAKGITGFGGIIIIINYLYFLPKQRQLQLYQKYKEVQSTKRDIFTIILSVVSIALLFFT